MLISPTRTLTSCGTSSMLIRRRIRPTRVTRGSSLSLKTGSSSSSMEIRPASFASASTLIVRSLYIRNGRPCRPARIWEKRTGPELSSLIAIATTIANGAKTSNPAMATPMSKRRRISSVEREGSQVLYSRIGRSASWATRSDGSALPRRGETTLILTCRARQRSFRSPIRSASTPLAATTIRSTRSASVRISSSRWAPAGSCLMSLTPASSRCISLNIWNFRCRDSRAGPSPTSPTRSGGIRFHQSQRVRERKPIAVNAAATNRPIAVSQPMTSAGVRASRGMISALVTPTQPRIAGTSSAVRCRSAR